MKGQQGQQGQQGQTVVEYVMMLIVVVVIAYSILDWIKNHQILAGDGSCTSPTDRSLVCIGKRLGWDNDGSPPFVYFKVFR